MQAFDRSRKSSFNHAWKGLLTLIKTQPNARLELVFTLLAVAAGFLFRIHPVEWAIVTGFIALVFVAEIFNTMLEMILDKISPAYDEKVKTIKDMSAAGVLISAAGAAIAGLIIFLPKLKDVMIRMLEGM